MKLVAPMAVERALHWVASMAETTAEKMVVLMVAQWDYSSVGS